MELGKRTNRGLGAIKTGPIGCCILDHVVTLCSFLRRLTGELEKDPGRSKGVRRDDTWENMRVQLYVVSREVLLQSPNGSLKMESDEVFQCTYTNNYLDMMSER